MILTINLFFNNDFEKKGTKISLSLLAKNADHTIYCLHSEYYLLKSMFHKEYNWMFYHFILISKICFSNIFLKALIFLHHHSFILLWS